jgi:beta-glucanase (GH16 family)
MKYTIVLIVFLNTLVIFGQTPLNDPHWQVDWQDNFNVFNSSIWKKTNYCDHGGEPQLYLNQNVTVDNGNLILRLTKEDVQCPTSPPINVWECGGCSNGIKHYTSGMVISHPSNQVKFGYIEAKIKLPYGLVYWPAFWTWVGTPENQEIDIFEMIPGSSLICNSTDPGFSHTNNFMTTNMHNSTSAATFCTSKFMINKINDYTDWHKYAIEW